METLTHYRMDIINQPADAPVKKLFAKATTHADAGVRACAARAAFRFGKVRTLDIIPMKQVLVDGPGVWAATHANNGDMFDMNGQRFLLVDGILELLGFAA